ncbi:MAG: NADH-quinone oxidoreductase subunit L [Candidatus Omnitrophica bacterium]|nr:NADH-quinone oxidoreductase subunit L [Candidatus Omnitrophota bacterium]
MVALIPLLPALGAAVNGLFGRRYIKENAHWVAVGACGLSFLAAVFTFTSFLREPQSYEVRMFEWIAVDPLRIELAFLVDPLSMLMAMVVTGVGFLIHIYSIGYMHGDGGYHRYFAYLNLFMTAMLLLVLANNYLLMFLGWEGVGLCSYLLIGFWFHKDSAANAAKKAFLVNRIGDAGFILALFLIYGQCKSLVFHDVMSQAHAFSTGLATAIGILLFVGAMGKSAQIPLYVWLPDAMEGPTSVSALIHAATMVTAGVYMVARNSAIYALAPAALNFMASVGAITALFAASIALVQRDIKKVLAYSTVSQLGYMFLSCGVGAYVSGMFHLMTHAFFKGLLFLGSGSVIHALGGEQDMQHMGGLRKHMPITAATFTIATLAIAGIPPLAGFWSKDEILAETFKNGHKLLWGIGALTALMTSFYMFRLLFLTFYGKSRVHHDKEHHLHESPRTITIPLSILAFLSIFGGVLPGFPPERGWIHGFLSPAISSVHHAKEILHGAAEHGAHALSLLDLTLMAVSIGAALMGLAAAWYFYLIRPALPGQWASRLKSIHTLLFNKYWVDEIYLSVFVRPLLKLCNRLWDFDLQGIDGIVNGASRVAVKSAEESGRFDLKFIDGVINDIGKLFDKWHDILRRWQTGFVQNYALVMVIGVLVLATSMFFIPYHF